MQIFDQIWFLCGSGRWGERRVSKAQVSGLGYWDQSGIHWLWGASKILSRKVQLASGHKAWSVEINRKNLWRKARKRKSQRGRSGQRGKDIKTGHSRYKSKFIWQMRQRKIGRQLSLWPVWDQLGHRCKSQTVGAWRGGLHCRRILYQLSHKRSPKILECVAYPFSRGYSWPRNRTRVSRIARGFLTSWATRKAQEYWSG